MPGVDIGDIIDIKMVDILVRNVSPELHRELKIEAARRGITLSEYLRRMAETQSVKPGRPFSKAAWDELQAKWHKSFPIDPRPTDFDFAASIRESRNERDARIETAVYGKPLPKTYPDE